MNSESYPTENVVERAVDSQVNALVGNRDINLNTIIKVSMMKDMDQLNEDEMKDILSRIANSNRLEDFYIKKEYQMTYDLAGNIIPVNTINGEGKESEGNIESVISESEGSES